VSWPHIAERHKLGAVYVDGIGDIRVAVIAVPLEAEFRAQL
jgi:hypothetical protein